MNTISKKTLASLLLVSAIFISGCSGHIDSLRKPQTTTRIELKETYESKRQRNTPFCDETFVHRALKGFYYPEFEDSSGVYYRGNKGSVQFEALKVSCMEKLPFAKFDWGGIYIPNDPNSPAQLYSYGGIVPEGYVSPVPVPQVSEKPVPKQSDTASLPEPQEKNYVRSRGVLIETILRIDRNSIQLSPSQAKDGSLRAAITFTNAP
ncbi:hypothetical protein [Methylophilus sp.]|uniref:hypothetical protein n=1 Tax=Methylophilus sp. TaxID=29541 RepID=UPI0040351FE5